MTTAIWLWSIELVPDNTEDETAMLPDLKGYDVAATDDDSVGKVEELVTDDDGRTYLVVDTGFWIFGKKRMIPAGAVASIDTDKRRVHVSLSKDEIKKAPDYNEKRRNDTDERKHQEDYYGPFTARGSGR
ncbi:MAG TPA: PRC-barrel domain-containing protein [Ilumatobacteraceae bacterium]